MTNISQAALEEAILCLLCFSDEQAPIIALKIPDANIFTTQENKLLAETSLEYIKKFSSAPKGQLEYLLEADMRRGERGKLLAQQFDFLKKQSTEIEAAFVVEQLERFVSAQQLTAQLREALDLLNQGELERAQETAYKQVSSKLGDSSGIWLNNPREALRFLDRDEAQEFFSSGVDVLDERGVRPERKTLMFMIAPPKRGKTQWLVSVGKAGIQHHHRVLHISLEMSEEKVARRYLQSIFALTKTEAAQVRSTYFERDELGNVKLAFRELVRESVIAKRKDIAAKLVAMAPLLLIKEFPPGMLSIPQLYLYLETLKKEKNWEPDEIILDYADLMQLDRESLRIDTGRLYVELRGLAVRKNIALVTASQGNRASEEAKVVTSLNVAEDFSKVATCDYCLTYSQTPEERRLGLARVYVAAGRDEADKFMTLISQSYITGQFCIDSVPMNTELAQQLGGDKE